ncbi:MAG: SurA N-terminal domain-containing protein [Rugosibacter sp.]
MFESVRNNKKIVQGFLVLITLPFALWGVESYVRNADTRNDVATVGSAKISQQELLSALNEQQERLRAQSGGQIDPAMFETPQIRHMVLDSLISRHLLAQQGQKSRLGVSDHELARFIASIPAFQESGKFSKGRYEAALSAQGMRQDVFEARMRQDMVTQQLVFPVVGATIPGDAAARQWLMPQMERREVAEANLSPNDYLAQVQLPADAAQKYYAANHGKFELPAQVRAEYVVLSSDALSAQLVISDADIKARYDAQIDKYKEPETRRASHILITVAKDAPATEVKKAQDKVQEVLAKLKQSPSEFARLAKEYSQDTQSAEKGGDLGWFGRGAMVKAFEDAAFQLKEGQTSEIVRSDFGLHIIRVTGIRAERVKALADVKTVLAGEIRRETGARKYAEAAEAFGNMVYEQADSLMPAAEKWKLAVQQTGWLAKTDKLPPPFDNVKLANALFSDDAVKGKHNTEAIEVAPGVLVSARAVEYKAPALQDFAKVKAGIEAFLMHEEAAKLAVKDGEAKLARLTKGDALDLKWAPSRQVSRVGAQEMPINSLQAVFRAKANRLPAYAGVALPGGGYAIYRIEAIKSPVASKGDPSWQAGEARYRQIIAEEEAAAWIATLKEKFPVSVNKSALEKR